jgi:hypothetical protein
VRSYSRTTKGIHSQFYGFYTSISEAIKEHGDPGIQAIKLELDQMIMKQVWTPCKREDLSQQQLKKVIPSLIFLKQKYKPDGSPDKVKARLVAGGHRQDASLYSDTSSPTVEVTNVFIECAIAAARNKRVATADIGAAFLNPDLEKDVIHMKLDKHVSEILCQYYPSYKDFVDEKGKITV